MTNMFKVAKLEGYNKETITYEGTDYLEALKQYEKIRPKGISSITIRLYINNILELEN